MQGYPATVCAPSIGAAFYVVCHLALSWLPRRTSQRLAIMGGFLIALAAETLLSIYAIRSIHAPLADQCGWMALNLLTYAALGFGYFGLVNLNLASLRIRILKEFAAAGEDVLPPEQLLAGYNAESIVTMRLNRLKKWDQLRERDGRLVSGKPGFLTLARCVDFAQLIVCGRTIKPCAESAE